MSQALNAGRLPGFQGLTPDRKVTYGLAQDQQCWAALVSTLPLAAAQFVQAQVGMIMQIAEAPGVREFKAGIMELLDREIAP